MKGLPIRAGPLTMMSSVQSAQNTVRHFLRTSLCWFCHQVQVNTWQLISVIITCQCQPDISVIAETLLGLVRMRARVPAMFSIQEAKSCGVSNLELPGYVCYRSIVVSQRCWFQNSFAPLRSQTNSIFLRWKLRIRLP